MKPGTILEYRCPKTGIVFQWRVHSIVLGAQRQEGLIEVSSVHARPGLTVSGQIMHTTWVPEVMTRTLVQVDPRADADDRIEELEAKLETLDHAYDSIVQALQFEGLRTDEAEAKLAKVIAVMHLIVDQRGYADDPWGIVQTTLAELEGQGNDH